MWRRDADEPLRRLLFSSAVRVIVKTVCPRRRVPVLAMMKILIDSNALAAAASLLLGLGATEVFVFGSATKGGLRPGSDIDLAVRGLPPFVYFSAVSRTTDLLGRPVDLVDLDDATPFVRYLLGSGELFRIA